MKEKNSFIRINLDNKNYTICYFYVDGGNMNCVIHVKINNRKRFYNFSAKSKK